MSHYEEQREKFESNQNIFTKRETGFSGSQQPDKSDKAEQLYDNLYPFVDDEPSMSDKEFVQNPYIDGARIRSDLLNTYFTVHLGGTFEDEGEYGTIGSLYFHGEMDVATGSSIIEINKEVKKILKDKNYSLGGAIDFDPNEVIIRDRDGHVVLGGSIFQQNIRWIEPEFSNDQQLNIMSEMDELRKKSSYERGYVDNHYTARQLEHSENLLSYKIPKSFISKTPKFISELKEILQTQEKEQKEFDRVTEEIHEHAFELRDLESYSYCDNNFRFTYVVPSNFTFNKEQRDNFHKYIIRSNERSRFVDSRLLAEITGRPVIYDISNEKELINECIKRNESEKNVTIVLGDEETKNNNKIHDSKVRTITPDDIKPGARTFIEAIKSKGESNVKRYFEQVQIGAQSRLDKKKRKNHIRKERNGIELG